MERVWLQVKSGQATTSTWLSGPFGVPPGQFLRHHLFICFPLRSQLPGEAPEC